MIDNKQTFTTMIIDREALKQIPIYGEWVPEENSKEMFRPAVKWLSNEFDKIHEALHTAELMDGSGECAEFIWAGYEGDLVDLRVRCEAIFNLDLEVLEDWLHESAEINDKFIKEPHYYSDKTHFYMMVNEIVNYNY